MNESVFEKALEDHRWLMRHCVLLRERFDKLPRWALIRQKRILVEWDIALDLADQSHEAMKQAICDYKGV